MHTQKLPSSEESEIIVIASILMGGAEVFDEVSQVLNSSDFFVANHQVYFDTFAKMAAKGAEIDEIEVLEQIRRDGVEERLGGVTAIYAIMSRIDTPRNAKRAAKEVLGKSKLRKIIRAARVAQEAAYNLDGTSESIAADLEDDIQKISDVEVNGSGLIAEATCELRDDIKSMLNGTYTTTSMPTGVSEIDKSLSVGGVGNGEVMVLSAPTSCGKTQFALCSALRSSVTHNQAGLYFSFEMPAKQLSKRMVQTVAGVNLKQANDGVMNTSDQQKVWDALEKVEKAPIYTEHYVKNIAELRAKARTHKRKHGIKWIVIDYLQLVPWDPRMKKHDAIAEVSHQVKLMAMELNLPVILLAQVNREGAKRDTGLTLYDLKDSGDIENDADIILLMWPDGKDVDEARKIDAEGKPYVSLKYNIAKQREGERDVKGTLKFISHYGRFQ